MIRYTRAEQFADGTVYNRLQPGGAIILFNHRMHEDDDASPRAKLRLVSLRATNGA